MRTLRIAAAQSISVPGDIRANVSTHCRLIDAAAARGVDLIVFPELSLTGYEPGLLRTRCVHPADPVLAPLREGSRRSGMTVVVGAPLSSDTERPHIGAITYFPDGRSAVYLKQHLHPSEDSFACAGKPVANTYPLPSGDTFALAICADTSHASHAEAAFTSSASVYVASALVSMSGYEADADLLQRYSERHGFGVLLANHGGPSGPYVSAGRSAFWSPGGRLVVSAEGVGSCLVLATRETGGWSGEALAVEM